jgi:hypothetical protein
VAHAAAVAGDHDLSHRLLDLVLDAVGVVVGACSKAGRAASKRRFSL